MAYEKVHGMADGLEAETERCSECGKVREIVAAEDFSSEFGDEERILCFECAWELAGAEAKLIDRFPAPPKAAELGHELYWDPAARGYPRYTCRTCGCATVKVTTFWYGSAVEQVCTG